MSTPLSWLQPPSRALIIGINEYENESISNLQGCVRDALDVATFLFADLGMPANHIRLLTSPTYTPPPDNNLLAGEHLKEFLGQSPTPDQERLLTSPAFAEGTLYATRANIISGIRDFLGNAAPGEEVFFYYSGHGSINDLKKEISFGDKKGETLVPADTGQIWGSNGKQAELLSETYQILDRELRYLLAELLEKGIRLTSASDSCHSGDLWRVVAPEFQIPPSLTNRFTYPSRALIVGVSEYENEEIPNLNMCVRNALEVTTFLFANLRMPANQIRLLSSPTYTPPRGNKLLARHHLNRFLGKSATPDQERLLASPTFAKGTLYATQANIISGIRDFLGNAAPGEEVFFFYSGHELINNSEEEEEMHFADQVKLADVAEDGSQPSYTETHQILARELRDLKAELLEKGIQLTIATDEHSAPKSRLTTVSHKARGLNTLLDGEVDFRRLEALYSGIPLSYTEIAGCLSTELSYEVKGKDRRYRGAMTSALLRTLRAVKGAVTYRELGRALRSSVPEHPNKDKQHPNITGKQERLPFSNQTIRRSSPLFAVQKVRKRWIELDGGQLEGVNQGCILTCYSDWSLKTAQGEYKVVKSRANVARAEPIKSSKPVYPKMGQPLMLKTRADRPTVFFDLSAHKIAKAWRERDDSAGQGGRPQPTFANFDSSNSAFGFGVSTQKQEEEEDEAWQESNSWKGVPYLIEAFSEDADYRVSVEEQMLVVKQRDGSLVEALHKEIHDPESNHPTTIPFNKRRHQTAHFLSFLLDRIINYQTFVAKKQGKRDTLKLSLAGEKPDVKVEVQFDQIFRKSPLTADGRFPLPAGGGARLHVKITNQTTKNKDLFVNLYYLDPKLYFAQRIWPSDGTDLLQAQTSRASIWEPNWKDYDLGERLNLKLFVSTEPLNLEHEPCGGPDWNRGASVRSVRPLKNSFQGWNTYHFVLGATKETDSGHHFF